MEDFYKKNNNEVMADPNEISILNYLPKVMLQEQQMPNPIMMEFGIWSYFLEQNLIEPQDKKEINKFKKNAIKYSLVSLFAGGLLNRGLSMIKIKGKDILKIPFLLRVPIRLGVFGFALYFITFNPMLSNLMRLHYYLNMKYSKRLQLFNSTCDPKVMNTLFLDDPALTPEQRDIKKFEYDKVRSRHAMIMEQNKAFEMMSKRM